MPPYQQYSYRPATPLRRQPPPPPKRSLRPYAILFLILLAGGLFGLHLLRPHHTSAEQTQAVAKVKQTTPLSPQASATLDSTINGVLQANTGVDISATLIDLNTGATRSYGPNVAYEAASVAKLITAVDYAQHVENGQVSWSTTLEDGDSASTAFQKMIVNSDNTAWQSLYDQLGMDTLTTTAQSIGINDYDLDDNSLTTQDIATLLQKLYAGKLLNAADTKLLLSDMKIASENTYITPAVPSDVTVYHKAGLLDDRIHDAAIIDNGSRPLVLVIFTNGHGTYDFPARTTAIQAITKAALTAYNIK